VTGAETSNDLMWWWLGESLGGKVPVSVS